MFGEEAGSFGGRMVLNPKEGLINPANGLSIG